MTPYPTRDAQSAGLEGFVCCRVGEEQYAIRGADVQNVARADAMDRRSGGGGQVGTLRDGGHEIPVYSLAMLLRLAHASRSVAGHIVIAGGQRAPFGLLVDRIARAEPEHVELFSVPEFAGRQAASWFHGLLRFDDIACLMLVPSALDPRAQDAGVRGVTPAPRRTAGERVQPSDMVVTFATTALPPSGTARYAVSGQRVAALVQSLPSIPLPGCSPHVKELAWWQKAAVPILEFNGGRANARRGATRLLVARCGDAAGGHFVAFPVDADVLLHRATADDAQVVGRDGLPFVRGIFKVSGECVALLDLDALTRGTAAPVAPQVPVLI